MTSIGVKYVGALAALALLGCGGGAEAPSGAETSSGAELAQYEGPIASADAERGREIFEAHCDDCHPDGGEDVGPSLTADAHSPAQIRKQIREGSGRMKPFPEKRLSDDDLEHVLAYLASINAVK